MQLDIIMANQIQSIRFSYIYIVVVTTCAVLQHLWVQQNRTKSQRNFAFGTNATGQRPADDRQTTGKRPAMYKSLNPCYGKKVLIKLG